MAETIQFVDPNGAVTTLQKLRGATGRWMPDVQIDEQAVPGEDGARFRLARFGPRQTVVPILLDGATDVAYRAAVRALAASLNPKRGRGLLRATFDGAVREIDAIYVDGMGFTEDFPVHGKPSLLFRHLDPFWYDSATTTQAFTSGTPQTFFPIFPIRLSSSTVFASTTVTNTGDVEAWPVWTITGPGSGLVLRNLTTGKVLALTRTFVAGEVVTIDTSPGAKTVLTAAGASLFSSLTSRQFWPLSSGANSIQVELSAATAASSVNLAYRRRFLSA